MEFLIIVAIICLIFWALNHENKLNSDFNDGARMGNFEVRLFDEETSDLGIDAKRVQIRGLIPVSRVTDLGFVIILDDVTDFEPYPVISLVEECRAENSLRFCHSGNIGLIERGQGWPNWTNISGIFPNALQTPYSGKRKIRVRAFLYDKYNKPDFSLGYIASNEGFICNAKTHFFVDIEEAGYQEKEENKKEAQLLAIEIAMGLSFTDGSFDKKESKVIKDWAKKYINTFPESERDALKAKFNDTFKMSYNKARSVGINLDDSIYRLKKIGDSKSKNDVLELCYSVMAADGKIDPKEVKFIDDIAKKLDFDAEVISKMRDSVILTSDASLENILGIDNSWSREEIKKYLRREFQKWNNRINTLPEGSDRERAQSMLDSIAEARKKYNK
jgi:tellurite resistance protein